MNKILSIALSLALSTLPMIAHAVSVEDVLRRAEQAPQPTHHTELQSGAFYEIMEEAEPLYSNILDFVNSGIQTANANSRIAYEKYEQERKAKDSIKQMCRAQCEGFSKKDGTLFGRSTYQKCVDECDKI